MQYSSEDNLEKLWRTYEKSSGYKVLHSVQEKGNWEQYEKKNPLTFEEFNWQFRVKKKRIPIELKSSSENGDKPIFRFKGCDEDFTY